MIKHRCYSYGVINSLIAISTKGLPRWGKKQIVNGIATEIFGLKFAIIKNQNEMMNRWLPLTLLLLLFIQFAKADNTTDSIPFTKITVYTTADSTTLRLTPTDTLGFHFFGQPLESEPCIFVDPSKTFQTF